MLVSDEPEVSFEDILSTAARLSIDLEDDVLWAMQYLPDLHMTNEAVPVFSTHVMDGFSFRFIGRSADLIPVRYLTRMREDILERFPDELLELSQPYVHSILGGLTFANRVGDALIKESKDAPLIIHRNLISATCADVRARLLEGGVTGMREDFKGRAYNGFFFTEVPFRGMKFGAAVSDLMGLKVIQVPSCVKENIQFYMNGPNSQTSYH